MQSCSQNLQTIFLQTSRAMQAKYCYSLIYNHQIQHLINDQTIFGNSFSFDLNRYGGCFFFQMNYSDNFGQFSECSRNQPTILPLLPHKKVRVEIN